MRRLLGRWRAAQTDRRVHAPARPAPDPADCDTAWGLELTVPPKPSRAAPRGPARR